MGATSSPLVQKIPDARSSEGANERLKTLLHRYTSRIVPDLFAANDLQVVAVEEPESPEGYGLAGIIGFVGDLCGTLLLGASSELLCACHPARRKAAPIHAEMQLDWVGELANQVIGPMTIRLAAHDLHVDFSPPLSVMGSRMRHLGSSGQTFRATFRAPVGDVRIWFDADLSDTVGDKEHFFEDPPEIEAPEQTLIMF